MTIYDPQEYDEPPTPNLYERWVPGHGWELIPVVPRAERYVYVASANPLPEWRLLQGFYYDRRGQLRKKDA